MNTIAPQLMTITAAATYMGLHRNTVYTLVREGCLPAVRVGARGSHIRIPIAAINSFVERSTETRGAV